MNRKLIFPFALVGFFLMWGVFGFAAAPRGEPDLRTTLSPVDVTPTVAVTTDSAGVPVTGQPEPVLMEILVFYGLIGLTALFLILALLNIANRSTAPSLERKSSPSDERK